MTQTDQRAKKVVSDSPGLVDFAIRLVDSDHHLPDRQVKFSWELKLQNYCKKYFFNFFNMMALSTVIGRPIFSLYPECNTNTRPLFHKTIVPRDCSAKKPGISVNMAMILWSRDSNLDNRPGSWYQPNHFIPIFEAQGKPAQPSTTVAPDKDPMMGCRRESAKK